MNASSCNHVRQAELRKLKEEDEGSKAAHSDSEDDGRRILIKPNICIRSIDGCIGCCARRG